MLSKNQNKFNENCFQFILNILVLTLFLITLIRFNAKGAELNQMPPKFEQSKNLGRNEFLYNNWIHSEMTDNENSINNINEHIQTGKDYSCGRAVASKRYQDLLLRDQLKNSRAKYRPLEIRMPRIIGGDETVPGEFPWTASVKLNGQPICGGSLINRSWILTAAHCVVGYNPKNLTVRLGAYRIKDLSETQTVDIAVSMFIVHKDYSIPRPFSNDIAMLKLGQPVEFTDFILPICLPIEDQTSSATTTSSIGINDYANKLMSDTSLSPDYPSGIVVSTEMSDKDIANCFIKLEQNYLNSIGLGTTEASNVEQSNSYSAYDTGSTKLPSHMYPNSETILDSLFMSQSQQNSIKSNENYDNGYNNNYKGHISQVEMLRLLQQNEQHAMSNMFDISSQQNPYKQISYNNYDFYDFSSAKRGVLPDEDINRFSNKNSGKDMIKLSKLPISKELLREIQSIGSGALSELDFNLAHNDFMSIASDLTGNGYSPENNHNDELIKHKNQSTNGMSPTIRFRDVKVESNEIENDNEEQTKYSGLNGIVVGWGWMREFDGDDQIGIKGYPSVTLQKVKLPILRNNVCEAWFQSQAKKITLLQSQFCAGFSSGGKDACRGDSGGPMIIEDDTESGRFKLIGIVSAGIGCARPSLPGLYTKVASFLPWINAQIMRY